MAKTSKKKRNESITINTIYETMKDRSLVQKLWMEIISDIADKPTYKHIKEMVSRVVDDTLGEFDTEPVDHSERLRRRGIFTEISIMAYTVDRVISEFLYRKLQTEFKSMLGNMLEEIQTEKKVKSDASPKINSMFENIESIFTKTEPSSIDEGPGNSQQVVADQKPVRKRGRPKKVVPPSAPSTSEPSCSKIVETSERDNFKTKDSDQDSNLTFESLSSVNTTDLSSFDDTVSICTEDGKNGRRKKQVPLKNANNMITEGKISDLYKVKTNVEIKKRKREAAASRKVLPQRKRKPNSKYNAETMYCQVKDYSSPRDSPDSDETAEDSDEAPEEAVSTKSENSQEVKRAKISNKNESSSPTKPVTARSLRNVSPTKEAPSQNVPTPTSNSSPLKNSTQRYTSSDLYKPRFHFGSSCHNRSASAFTIFSS